MVDAEIFRLIDSDRKHRDAADWLTLVLFGALIVAIFCAVGCKPEHTRADDSAAQLARAIAVVAVIDADEETKQIALPDSLEKGDSTGLASSGALQPGEQDAQAPVESLIEITSILPIAPIVQAYTRDNCEACKAAKRDCKAVGIEIIEHTGYPSWWKAEQHGDGLPVFEWQTAGGKLWYIHGYPGFGDFFRRYAKSILENPPDPTWGQK